MSMNDDDRATRGRRAQKEFRELEAAFQRTSDAIMTKLVQTPPTQPDTILKLHMSLQNLSAVRQALVEMAQDGAIAEVVLANAGLAR
jgi:hypothetical protein